MNHKSKDWPINNNKLIINLDLEIQFLHSFKDSFTRNSCYKYNKGKFTQLLFPLATVLKQ